MARRIATVVTLLMLIASAALAAPALPAHAPPAPVAPVAPVAVTAPPRTVAAPATTARPRSAYRHGDCSWIPAVAAEAGWPAKTHERLIAIIKRESGCCPSVRGGDVADGNCQIKRVREWNHRSDSGLLQINGVHWKRDHPQYHGLICRRMLICEQEPLLDPLTNLRAGKLLWDVAGWSPWKTASD